MAQSLWGEMVEKAVWRVRRPREVPEAWAAKAVTVARLAMADREAQGATATLMTMVAMVAKVAMEQQVLPAASVPQDPQVHSAVKALRLLPEGMQNSR